MVPEQQLRAYIDYLRDMGIYDIYRRDDPKVLLPDGIGKRVAEVQPQPAVSHAPPVRPAVTRAEVSKVRNTTPAVPVGSAGQAAGIFVGEAQSAMPKPPSLDSFGLVPAEGIAAVDRASALQAVRDDIGECTRCPLAYAGRHTIVFGDGDPNARIMFVGEGPGADEDATGVPFVGKAGQLLDNMIAAMGLKRDGVYIANIVKCRPPSNRVPEFVEATTCTQFLARQIDIVRPEVIVALGATAATYLLGVKQPLASLRGQWHSVRGAKVAVTYHPAFLLRDPRQKGEAWKDLQRVMVEMGLSAPKRAT